MSRKMKTQFLIFCFYLGIFLVFAEGDELSSLLAIRSSLVDPLGYLNDWKVRGNEAIYCNWTGVWCNARGFVERLDFSRRNLSGIISDSIQGLSKLSSLNICCNGFSSSLPNSLSNLTSLKSIDVSDNNFIGSFPAGFGRAGALVAVNASSNNFSGALPDDLGNATMLGMLDFRGSFFEGNIPSSFKNLQNLRFLGLSGNNLTGRIPRDLGMLSSLETVILGYNEFEGEIPPEFGNLTNLRYLDLAIGSLGGQIPPELGRLQKLNTIFLYKNKFTGKIPSAMGNITSLVFMDLSDNYLSGVIPEEIAELKNLQLLNLMCNKLSGPVPQKLGELTKLEVLELWKNSLSGPLPANLGKNSPLQWLDVSSNSFSGEIPSGLCDSGSLTKLILFNNSFSGPIPLALSKCNSLVRVRAHNNSISGTISGGLGYLSNLRRLELANNHLTGEIPKDITSSLSLSFIDFSGNHFNSSLPPTILSIPNLQTFMASDNNLTGKIPDHFQDWSPLSVLDLSNNQFSGKIPERITSCEKLVTLNFRNNRITGEIPTSIATMPALAILDLSKNSLVGQIPENFGSSPAMETFNFSYNNLEGPIPSTGLLGTTNPNNLIGNAGLCGSVLPPCPKGSNPIRPRSARMKHAIGFAIGISVIICISLAILAGRWLYRRSYFYGTSWLKNSKEKEWPWRLVAFQRLNFTSTEILACLKESNIIGMGGAGIVYKAEIQRLRITVAVKKLWRSGRTDLETGDDLLGEVNLLGRLRHRNIVRLLGYLHNEADVMMVYEYMPNGNLEMALHRDRDDAKILVDWISRYDIALGVAQGLNYLHNDSRPPVIHRDIKSNNILLDVNLNARIADFGLAKMMVKGNPTVSMVAGSYGYIAPEYGYTLKVDEKSDIYSFGVVLLELVTGKTPLDPLFGESTDIVEWTRGKIRNTRELEESLDPSIAGQCKFVQEEMLLVLRIALLCTAKQPKDRPSMRDVITMLGEAKPRRKSLSHNGGQSSNKDRPVFSTSPVLGFL